MPLGSIIAIHVPRVLYWAALTWYCFLQFSEGQTDRLFDSGFEFPELLALGVDPRGLLLEEENLANQQSMSILTSKTLGGLVDLLGRIGNWELSRKLASLMTTLVLGDSE